MREIDHQRCCADFFGLRSVEVLALNPDDVLHSEGQLRVRSKGSKLRFLPRT